MSPVVVIGLGAGLMLLGACQSGSADDASDAAGDGTETPATSPSETSPSETPASASSADSDDADTDTDTGSAPPTGSTASVFPAGDIDHGLDPYIRRAKDDLAARLAIETDQIETVSAVLVEWPDASLGCPEPDRSYAMVTTDGGVIELSAGGQVYRYHSGGSTRPFLCERALRSTPTRL